MNVSIEDGMIDIDRDILLYRFADLADVYRITAVSADLSVVRVARAKMSEGLALDYTLDDLLDEFSPVPLFGLKAEEDRRIQAIVDDAMALTATADYRSSVTAAVMRTLELVEAGEL